MDNVVDDVLNVLACTNVVKNVNVNKWVVNLVTLSGQEMSFKIDTQAECSVMSYESS